MAMALAGLSAYSIHSISLALINEKSSMITSARNSLTEKALALNTDYLLWVDSDLVFPADALVRLLSHDKDIVGATYNRRVAPFETLGRLKGPPRDLAKCDLVEAHNLPGGFLLVKADVYRAIEWPWYAEVYTKREDKNPITSEDITFCNKAREAGFSIWCDIPLTSKLAHIGEQVVTCDYPSTGDAPTRP